MTLGRTDGVGFEKEQWPKEVKGRYGEEGKGWNKAFTPAFCGEEGNQSAGGGENSASATGEEGSMVEQDDLGVDSVSYGGLRRAID